MRAQSAGSVAPKTTSHSVSAAELVDLRGRRVRHIGEFLRPPTTTKS